MRIAIALYSNHLDSKIHPLFGRCNWFCIYDSKTKKTEFIENSNDQNEETMTCPVAESLIKKDIQCAAGGAFSPRTGDLLLKKNICMIVPEQDTSLKDILDRIK